MKMRLVGALVGAALAAACGGRSSGTPVAQPPVSSPPVVSATPSPVPVGPKGIIAGTAYASNSTVITIYDPVTHRQSTDIPSAPDCSYSVGGGWGSSSIITSVRQNYSPNFDKVVW